ncbi:MAG: DUF47 domain-containing protein [Candidatus Micrarchaeia archaeon]
MGIIDRILQGGEEGIIKKFNTIIGVALDTNEMLDKLIEGKSSLDSLRVLEKRSDDVAFEITNMVTSGGVAPNLIDDMLALVDKEDSIVDSMYNLAREIGRYKIKNKKARLLMTSSLKEMTALARQALIMLRKMQASDDLAEIKRLRKEIEGYEEKGDEIKDNLFDFAYNAKIGFRSFYHLFEVAHQADDMLDNCEDSSDIYLTIMSSIIS